MMNAINHPTLTTPTAATKSGPEKIGVALFALPPGSTTFLSFRLFRHALETALHARGIEFTRGLGFSSRAYLLVIIETADRAGALAAVHEVVAEMELATSVAVAWYDSAEESWRNAGPLAIQFGELLDRPSLLLALQDMHECLNRSIVCFDHALNAVIAARAQNAAGEGCEP